MIGIENYPIVAILIILYIRVLRTYYYNILYCYSEIYHLLSHCDKIIIIVYEVAADESAHLL